MPFRLSDRSALALTFATLVFSTHVFASEAPRLRVALDYQVDPGLSDCPTAADLSSAIEKQLGYDPFLSEPSPIQHRVKASIQRTGAGTEAHVEWLDARGGSEGERRLSSESADCAEIARGLSFAIAVQIQLRASAETPPPAAPPPAAAAPAARKPLPPRKESRRVILVGVGALASHGLTPGLRPGLRVFGSLGNERVSFEVSTQATLPAQQGADSTVPHSAPLSAPPSFTARELTSRLAPCLRLSLAGACGVFMFGQLHVRGEGVDQVRSPSALVVGAGAKLQLLWPALPSFGVLLQAEALALLTPRDVLINREVVWSTAPVVLGASLDLAAIFR